MRRTLSTNGIVDLEALFEASKGDAKVLKQLAHELRHRSTLRASSLLAAVEAALGSPGSDAAVDAPAVSQLTLIPPSPLPGPSHSAFEERAFFPLPDLEEDASTEEICDDLPTLAEGSMTADAACRVLKVGRSASWAAIENARREIVSRASPEVVKDLSEAASRSAVEQATKANEAARALWLVQNPAPP